MTNINNGGPAFPLMPPVGEDGLSALGYPSPENGMSLRDWFAGQMAAAAMTNANGLGTVSKEERAPIFAALASISYELADAMLAARSKVAG